MVIANTNKAEKNEAAPKITDFDRIARMNGIMRTCLDRRMNLVAEALRLGYPYFTNDKQFPTAAIQIVKKDGRIRYIWNREFFDSCTDLAVMYICFHESLHVTLNHIPRCGDRNPQYWNIAVDMKVNDILDELLTKVGLADAYKINCDPNLMKRYRDGSYGIRTNGKTAESVYKLIMKKKQKQQEEDERKEKRKAKGKPGEGEQQGQPQPGSGDSGEDEEDDGTGGSTDRLPKEGHGPGALDSHDEWNKEIAPETQQAIADIVEDLKIEEAKPGKGRRRSKGIKPGNSTTGLIIELEEVNKPETVPWQKLLKNRLASVYRPNDAENWARVHRKMYQWYPDIVLPGQHETETSTSSIFLAIDTSGSMDDNVIAELAAIVRSLPEEHYEIRITWFDTELYECMDLTKPQGRGGTSFVAIEQVVCGERDIWKPGYDRWALSGTNEKNERVARYPDVVVVLTDGEAYTPHLEHPERWIFILTKKGTDQYVKDLGSTIWKLTE